VATKVRKKLTRSQEDYLEAILQLVRERRVARVRDIAARLGVGMPSVTAALKALSRRGLVNYDPYQFVTLTDRGAELGGQVVDRHERIRRILTDFLGLDAAAAETSACRLEHAVGPSVLERLEAAAESVRQSPRAQAAMTEALARLDRPAERPARPRRARRRKGGETA